MESTPDSCSAAPGSNPTCSQSKADLQSLVGLRPEKILNPSCPREIQDNKFGFTENNQRKNVFV
jgi:hypothetical protein